MPSLGVSPRAGNACPRLSVWVGGSMAARALGLDGELRMHAVLRHHLGPRRRMDLRDALRAVAADLHMTRQHVARLHRRGEGLFWRTTWGRRSHRPIIEPCGLVHLAAAFAEAVDALPEGRRPMLTAHVAELPLDLLPHLQAFRAACFEAVTGRVEGKEQPRARETHERRHAVQPRTQRRWAAAVGTENRPQAVLVHRHPTKSDLVDLWCPAAFLDRNSRLYRRIGSATISRFSTKRHRRVARLLASPPTTAGCTLEARYLRRTAPHAGNRAARLLSRGAKVHLSAGLLPIVGHDVQVWIDVNNGERAA